LSTGLVGGMLRDMTLSTATDIADVSDTSDYAHQWALVDVETSGLRPSQHRVLSVAVITIDADGRQTGEYATLLNPGPDCDPGPVHIHGLTPERLRGAPAFDEVAGRIGAMLQGRVMVAHNAHFDYGFLAQEFARVRSFLPVSQRLCTLALNRRLDPPTPDLKLATLATHYGITQHQAHDALDDTRVLAGILRGSLTAAAQLGAPLPLVACPPRQDPGFSPRIPKTPCPFRNPGRVRPGEPLTQGTKIAITGETATPRPELVARAVAAGLNVMTTVSGHTGVLVTNHPEADSAKTRRALSVGVPLIDEPTFLRLLADVRPGTPHGKPADAMAVPTPRRGDETTRNEGADRPLTGHRVLVLGGPPDQAAAARTRVVELGASAAVNLSASVTDVLCLPGGHDDRRIRRITELGLPVHDPDWLNDPAPDAGTKHAPTTLVLPRGGVVDLPTAQADHWTVTASWAQHTTDVVDVVAFIVDDDEQVSSDDDFVFYNAPESPYGSVRLHTDGPTEQVVITDLGALPPAAHKVVIAAAIDGQATFGDIGAIEVTALPGDNAGPFAQATLDASTSERTLLLAEIYRRGPLWRIRVLGQGYDHGLDTLARDYGIDIEP
jgi:DNA polymerase III subunit epsilon